ncbi:MAG: fimbria/pilus periplasmic chaperone [Citrobacter amalonaticus]|nr:fimbria/pilus periplasmic chaperone [Citrobacter amalonaticus]
MKKVNNHNFFSFIRFFIKVLPLILVLPGISRGAIAPDRTRIIFNEGEKSASITLSNRNTKVPYLAQGWLEDENGNKSENFFAVLPPVQKIGPGQESQIRLQALPTVASLPKERESVFWFNLREIPPKPEKGNTLQIALQTRIKLFYRPISIQQKEGGVPWQEKMILSIHGQKVTIKNPTPFFITIADIDSHKGGDGIKGFEPVMINPFDETVLNVKASSTGLHPVVTYVNDHGGRPEIEFICNTSNCQLNKK